MTIVINVVGVIAMLALMATQIERFYKLLDR